MSVRNAEPTPQQWLSGAMEAIVGFADAVGAETVTLTMAGPPTGDGKTEFRLETGGHDLADLDLDVRNDEATVA